MGLELFFFFPLIYPPTLVQWGARANRFRGRNPNPEKLFCMGNFKNRLTAIKASPGSHLSPDHGRGLEWAFWAAGGGREGGRIGPTLHLPYDLPYRRNLA